MNSSGNRGKGNSGARAGSLKYDTDYTAGQDNVNILGLDVHNPVFGTSAFLIIAFIVGALMFPADAKEMLVGARGWSIANFD